MQTGRKTERHNGELFEPVVELDLDDLDRVAAAGKLTGKETWEPWKKTDGNEE